MLSKSDKKSKFVHDKIVSLNISSGGMIAIGNCIREMCEVRNVMLECDFYYSDIDDFSSTMRCM